MPACEQKRSTPMDRSPVAAIASHSAIGIAAGLSFSLVLLLFPCFGVRSLTVNSLDPTASIAVFAARSRSFLRLELA
jgi:hypothetical protein